MDNTNLRVLIIDDDEGFCALVTRHLERSKFHVTCAYSAETGLDRIRNDHYDAIVMDHVLPEYDGLVLLQTAHTMSDAPPVIYLTGSSESRVAVAALKAGAADYVVKDIHGDFLILLESAINSAVAAASFRRAKEKAEAEVIAARDQFKALADERQLLLREVNHRVSNSLQLIASLLHFQREISSSPEIKTALKEASGRVLAVARVHRSLYTSHDVRWVLMRDYLRTLINDLADVSSTNDGSRTISLDADPVQVGPDLAVALGIVTTELVLNSLKHAYPDRKGEVRVRLKGAGDHIVLVVEDDGVGTIEGVQGTGLGKRIIAGMSDKLEGQMVYDPAYKGTRATLTMPVGPEVRMAE